MDAKKSVAAAVILVFTVISVFAGYLFFNNSKGDAGVYLRYYTDKGKNICNTESVLAYREKLGTQEETKEEQEEALVEKIEQQELPISVSLDIPELLQNPELPTGCESVALTILLLYQGYDLEKTTIADDYLIISKNSRFEDGYVGNPHTYGGAGCFPEILAKTADLYLQEQNAEIWAKDLSGKDFETLLQYVAAGYPVAVWTTMYMMEPGIDLRQEKSDGYTWYDSEHCVVLAGYDKEKETVLISDPLEGIIERSLSRFATIYEKVGQYAMVIL